MYPYQMQIADALFFLLHDEKDRPRVRARVLGLVLAAGLLGELAITRKIGLYQGGVYVSSRDEPQEVLSAGIFAEIRGQPGRDLLVWLTALAGISTARVTDRLVAASLLELPPLIRHRPFRTRRTPTHTIKNTKIAELSWLVPMNKLHRRSTLDSGDKFILGVAMAAGLDGFLLQGTPAATRTYADQMVRQLPDLLGSLVADVEATVGNDVLIYRN